MEARQRKAPLRGAFVPQTRTKQLDVSALAGRVLAALQLAYGIEPRYVGH